MHQSYWRDMIVSNLLSLLANILWLKVFGLTSGAALILSIYTHEYGHYIMAKLAGLNPSRPGLIPYLGGYVLFDEPNNQNELFKVAIMGPVFGGVLGIISLYLYLVFDGVFFYRLAIISLILNLFNLLPFSILDGAKVFMALGYNKLVLLVNTGLFVYFVLKKEYLLVVFGVLGFISFYYYRLIRAEIKPVRKENRRLGLLIYVLLVIILIIHFCFLVSENKYIFLSCEFG